MTLVEIIQFLLAIIMAGGGYWLSRLAKDVKELERNMMQCQTSLPEKYVMKSDYKDDIKEIKSMLGDLYDLTRNSQ